LDIANDFHEAVDLRLSIVNVKAGAGCGRDAEFFHEGLIAVVAAAESHATLIRDRDYVVRVNAVQQETDEAGAANVGAEEAQAL
jgi:hypothetical protein